MSRLVFMLEEPSMSELLKRLLPRLFPDLQFLCVPHEGKSDLERSLRIKLPAWKVPGDRFVVVRDADQEDCKALKAALTNVCVSCGRPDSLVRIVCRELEAWYFGQPEALAEAFEDTALATLGAKARYRNSDDIVRPAHELASLCPLFQKIGTARVMGDLLSLPGNTSPSFRNFVTGIARISGLTTSAPAIPS
jgi:hypothetical protein